MVDWPSDVSPTSTVISIQYQLDITLEFIGAKQTRMSLRRKMDFAHAEATMAEGKLISTGVFYRGSYIRYLFIISDATLVAVWAASFYWFMSIPQKGFPFSMFSSANVTGFEYNGFQPKPKLFTAFQFPRL